MRRRFKQGVTIMTTYRTAIPERMVILQYVFDKIEVEKRRAENKGTINKAAVTVARDRLTKLIHKLEECQYCVGIG